LWVGGDRAPRSVEELLKIGEEEALIAGQLPDAAVDGVHAPS